MTYRSIWFWLMAAVTLLLALSSGAEEWNSGQGGYRIGPNDVIRIQVFGEEDLSVESRVGGSGKLNYPLLGALQVEGQTLEDLQQELTKRLAAGYVRDPKVTVSIVRHRNFYVSGEVKTPGGFPFEDGMTVQKAVTMAGGFSEKAAHNALTITRRSGSQEELVHAQLKTPLLPDDTLVVGQVQKFFVMGEVNHPGAYPHEEQLTANKAISLGGGFTEKADQQGLMVTRVTDAGAQTLHVRPDDLILPSDILAVATHNAKVYVTGEVKTPGSYAHKDGLSLQKALAMAGGLTEKGDLNQLRIVRGVNDREEQVPVTLETPVLPEDTIVVPERQRFYVTGEVKTPGRYFYEPGISLQKAISMAGGFTEKADKLELKVERYNGTTVATMHAEPNAPILPDDLVVVPQARRFYVNGEVKKPGDYGFERGLTLHMAITMAGGFTEKASKTPKVLRMVQGKEQAVELALDAPILPDDVIVVTQRFF
jgi:protein involved in polysaccharide export with SLBB domain